jgi:glycosyltransferase involved in cell wall biosynthesis
MKHICHITSVHSAEDVRIFVKECRSLAAAGYKVSIVAAGAEEQCLDGVQVYGLPRTMGSRIRRFTSTVRSVMNKAISLEADAYHLHDPELLMACRRLKRTGAKIVFDAHEDFPKQLRSKPYLPSWSIPLLVGAAVFFERLVAAQLDGVIAATPLIAKKFASYNKNVVAVCNFPELTDMPEEGILTGRENAVCYIGGIFETRGAIEMVKAMEKTTGTILHLAGSYSPVSLRKRMLELPGWNRVREHGFVNRAAIRSILSSSQIGLVLLHPTASYREALPVKMFEYMAAGLPVIASDFPVLREIVERHQCGVLVNPLDVDAIAGAINHLMTHPSETTRMGKNGRRAVETEYNWSSQADVLIRFYERLLT